jgi:hypothetical protein
MRRRIVASAWQLPVDLVVIYLVCRVEIVAAENIPDAHFKSHVRSAELEQESVDQDVTLAQFACR